MHGSLLRSLGARAGRHAGVCGAPPHAQRTHAHAHTCMYTHSLARDRRAGLGPRRCLQRRRLLGRCGLRLQHGLQKAEGSTALSTIQRHNLGDVHGYRCSTRIKHGLQRAGSARQCTQHLAVASPVWRTPTWKMLTICLNVGRAEASGLQQSCVQRGGGWCACPQNPRKQRTRAPSLPPPCRACARHPSPTSVRVMPSQTRTPAPGSHNPAQPRTQRTRPIAT